jgi:hypothetical protein
MAHQTQNVDFQNVLMMHDRLKRSANLPLFYADESKDTMTGYQLIERVEITTAITNWDDKRKGQYLASILWGQAQSWWDTLDIFQIDKEAWANVNAIFLCSFELKHSANTVCANLQDLTRKSGESIYIYFAKNVKNIQTVHGQKTREHAPGRSS